MILVGLKLMVIGMGIVLLFLVLLVYIVKLIGRLLVKRTAKELEELRTVSRGKLDEGKKGTLREKDEILVAVFSAAIAAHHAYLRSRKSYKGEVVAP